jgi:predicted nucleic acid-binding protein
MLIVDTNVLIAALLDEGDSESAEALFGGDQAVGAPDLIWSECANVLWVKARRGEIGHSQARRCLDIALTAPIIELPSKPLMPAAQHIALMAGHPVYDCVFLAAAQAQGGPLVTLDARFIQAASAAGRGDHLRLLGA